MTPVRVGILGLGRWGSNYINTLARIPGCCVVAVSDTDPQKRSLARRRFGLPAFTDLNQMLESRGLDAAVIATPSNTHFTLAAEAIRCGLDVLVEKPVALSLAEACELADMADSSNVVLAIGHTAMYSPSFLEFRTALERCDPQQPLEVEVIRTATRTYASVEDLLWDLATHDLSVTIAALGEPVDAWVESSDRESASYIIKFGQARECRGTVAGSAAEVTRELRLTDSTASRAWREDLSLPAELDRQPLARQCLDFIDCCRNRGVPLSNGRLGVQVTRWVASLVESSHIGRADHARHATTVVR